MSLYNGQPDNRVVYYSGIGSKESHVHSVLEFLKIMREEFQDRSWAKDLEEFDKKDIDELNYKDWILPDEFCFFSLEDWVDFAGATLVNA